MSKVRTTKNMIVVGMFLLHALAASSWAGGLVAWGNDVRGQVSNTPGGYDFVAVTAGASHNVALKSDGSLVAWGYDGSGQVSNTPAGNDFAAVAAGSNHSLALKSDGSLIAWGYDGSGEVSNTPVGNNFVAIVARRAYNVALKSDGSLVAWGDDKYGQVSKIPAGNDFVAVAAGNAHIVALKSDGTLVAWGEDSYGLISSIPAGNDFVAIAAGGWHSVALKSDGRLVSWGTDVASLVSNTPVGNDFVAIAAGEGHSVALKSDGRLVAWGTDTYGQVSEIPAGNDFTAVTANGGHSVAISDTLTSATFTLITDFSPIDIGSVTKNPDKSRYSPNESVQLTATADSGYTFSHWSGDVTGTSNPITIIMNSNKSVTVNFAKPIVSISATDASAGEPVNDGSFRISRTGDTSSSLRVYYSTSGSTASAGIDYAAIGSYVDIPSGKSSATISVDVYDDSTIESTETVSLTIFAISTYIVGSPGTATVTITDDDSAPPPVDKPVVTVTAPDASAGEPADDGYFTISRTGDIKASLLVYYSTNGTASAGSDYTALPGYVYMLSGQSSATIPVVVNNDYTVENSETVRLTLSSNTAYTVGSPSYATVTITDDDSAPPPVDKPVLTIVAIDASAAEPANNGSFRVSRTGDNGSSLRVYYSTSGSTASAGSDYESLPGYVDILAGQSSATISIAVINDYTVESSETVRLTVSSNTAYDIGNPSYATVTITDDDDAPPPPVDETIVTITAPDASAAEPANDGSFRVSRTGDTSGNLLVYYSISGSTATSGIDYTSLPSYVYIPSGQSSADISVDVIDDSVIESSETVLLTIRSIPPYTTYTIGSSSNATVTIADDDNSAPPPVDKPVVTITAIDASAGEPSNDGSFRVSRAGDTTGNLLVYYSTNGTASAGSDYESLPGYVYILSGQSSATISVVVNDDTAMENSEYVRLTISSNTAYDIGSPYYATVTITDDDDIPDPPVVDVVQLMADTVYFFDSEAKKGTLVSTSGGKTNLVIMGKRLDYAYDQIVDGNYTGACTLLKDAYLRCDGLPDPMDYVEGTATDELAWKILEVIDALGCL